MTLGVRILARNSEGHVLLVRHTYVPGWHFPGGGVEKGETFQEAAKKEMLEEAGIEVLEDLEFFSLYANRNASKRDHVALMICRNWQKKSEFQANREIAEIGFFPLDALPDETTPATRRRLKEVFEGESPGVHW